MKIMLLISLQKMDLHEAIPIIEGHICKGQPQEFHEFSMKSSDHKVKAFLGRLGIDVTIANLHKEGQASQKDEPQMGKFECKQLPRVNVDIDILEKKSSENMDSEEQVSLSFATNYICTINSFKFSS